MATECSLRIMLVDDEEIIHLTVGAYLRRRGHKVDTAMDGTAGLAAIESASYDLLLTDMRMPGLDGLSLISRGRQIRPEMLAILITGHGDVEMENAAAGLVDGFLLKPIKLLELDSAIAQAVGGRNRQ